MRLTNDVILSARVVINPLRDRELDLRGYKIPALENLGATKDGFDCIDLSDNDLKKLENFPRLMRLRMLLLHNNHISRIQDQLGSSLPLLEVLILNNNALKSMEEVKRLVDLRHLEVLSLVGNPICSQRNYRQMIISAFPNLKILDYQKIKPQEREQAAKSSKCSDDGPATTTSVMEDEATMMDEQPPLASNNESPHSPAKNCAESSLDDRVTTTASHSIQDMTPAESVEPVNPVDAPVQHGGGPTTTIGQDDVDMTDENDAELIDQDMTDATEPAAPSSASSSTWTEAQVDQMKVVELKDALKAHQLSTLGRKAELLERLKDFLF